MKGQEVLFMQHLELSRKALEEQCSTWANNIKEVYQPDLIIYIARGGYLIGKQMKEVFQVPMIGVSTVRDGNGLKEKIGPLVAVLPNCIRNLLISIEMKSNKHAKNTERKVRFLKGVEDVKDKDIQKILVAEDSVDTGNSLQQAIKTIRTVFPDAEIKVASLNVWDKSKSIAHVDYALYENTIIKSPMSKDSKEYKEFRETYRKEVDER